METLQMTVTGMTAGECEDEVRRAVGTLAGVSAVTVDCHANLVGVEFDKDLVTPQAIRGEIEALGYQIAP
jgi:copper chaperone CopZ